MDSTKLVKLTVFEKYNKIVNFSKSKRIGSKKTNYKGLKI